MLVYKTPSVISLLVHVGHAMIFCYDRSGHFHKNESSSSWQPCELEAGTSAGICCGASDFCLDNGLCLSDGGENAFSVQGCTDPLWPAPCVDVCGVDNEQAGMSETYIWPCGNPSNAWCCGLNASCCNSASSSTFHHISPFSEVYRPGQRNVTPKTAAVSSNDGADDRWTMIELAIALPVTLMVLLVVAFGCWTRKAKRAKKDLDRERKNEEKLSASAGRGDRIAGCEVSNRRHSI
ncbi:putative Mid2 domain-containing protein [Seiridium unicorne]|uniref:Mid2 domain-containing protein n=1 Tax=Seiridium unicorne TaxID=138068 RepID=A0ABR2UWV7_9PEZI